MRTVCIVLAIVFLAIAVAYFLLPAESLPTFFPGFEPGSARVHVKHGIVAVVVAIVLFGAGWFSRPSPR
jgi:amino acid permease